MIECLRDDQWELIEPYIPPPPRRADGRGRPWSPARPILAAIFRLLHIGAQRTSYDPGPLPLSVIPNCGRA